MKRPSSLFSITFKHEGRSTTKVVRRLLRPLAIFIALWCLYLTFRSESVVTLSPGFDNIVDLPAKAPSRVAKASIAVNTLNNTIIHKAFRTHQVQNKIHGYVHHIATTEIVGDLSEHDSQHRPRGAWSKPAYLLSLIVNELTKPEDERLEWLL
jgi:UDP-2,3-diacylglucosamine pyrophosphatase LpxH